MHETINCTKFHLKHSEADEYLQLHEFTSIDNVLSNFYNKNGTFIRLDPGSHQKAILLPDDTIYPACSAGLCRSQTLWAILRAYKNKIKLFPPCYPLWF